MKVFKASTVVRTTETITKVGKRKTIIQHQLVSCDPVTRIGVFRVREFGADKWLEVDVSISNLLASRVANKYNQKLYRGDTYETTVFTSDLESSNYGDSPFRLVHYRPINGSDVPANFAIECVDEGTAVKRDAITKEAVSYRNFTRDNTKWERYSLRDVEKMAEELSAGTVIVYPEPRYVTE